MAWLCDDGICGIITNILLIIAAVLIFHYFYLLSNFNYWKKRGIFSPNSTSLIGDLPGQVTGKRNIMYEIEDLYTKFKNQYPYIGIFNLRSPRLLVFDPQLSRDILVKYFRQFQATEIYGKIDEKSDPLFGNHMFMLIGEKWKTKRQEMSPALTNSRIKAVHPIFESVYEKMDKFIRRETSKTDFNGFEAKDFASRFTLSVVANSIYNIDAGTFDDEESEVLNRAQAFLTPSMKFVMFQVLWSVYPFLSKFFKFSFSPKGSSQFFSELMSSSMKQREESGIKRVDYLEYLIGLKNRKEIDDQSIATHGASFLVDGYDTSSGVIAGALYELARNQQIQTRLRDEIKEKMPTDKEFDYDNIMSLEYLDQIWHETLRLHLPVSHFARICTEAVTIDGLKDKPLSFNVGDTVYLAASSVFKDPEFYENPNEFDPERFSLQNGGVKMFTDRGIFFPFGMGPRNCPGSRFAISQAKYCIAALVRNFEISLNPRTVENSEAHPNAFIVFVTNCYLNFKEIKRE